MDLETRWWCHSQLESTRELCAALVSFCTFPFLAPSLYCTIYRKYYLFCTPLFCTSVILHSWIITRYLDLSYVMCLISVYLKALGRVQSARIKWLEWLKLEWLTLESASFAPNYIGVIHITELTTFLGPFLTSSKIGAMLSPPSTNLMALAYKFMPILLQVWHLKVHLAPVCF